MLTREQMIKGINCFCLLYSQREDGCERGYEQYECINCGIADAINQAALAIDLQAELDALRQMRKQQCEWCHVWEEKHNKYIANILEHYDVSALGFSIYKFCPDCGRKLVELDDR